jgi:hypothetical protein
LIQKPVKALVGWFAGWLVGLFAGWLVGWLAGWLVGSEGLGWLVGWLACWLVCWLAGWLVAWFAGYILLVVSSKMPLRILLADHIQVLGIFNHSDKLPQ